MPASTEHVRVPSDLHGQPRRVATTKVSLRHTFRALRHRNYRLFFFGQLVSLVGTWMQQTAIAWLVYDITGSKFLLGAIAAVGSAPMMLFALWGGALADRYPKRSILVITQTVEMVFAFALAVQNLLWGVGQPFAGMIADRHGLGATFYFLAAIIVVANLFVIWMPKTAAAEH